MKKILVIEDTVAIRENIMELLEVVDYEVIGAENGWVGVQLAKEQLPDLIICDVNMPEIDGYGVLAALRSESVTATIPLIFLTGNAAEADYRQGIKMGVDDYITKPFTSKELLKTIATRLLPSHSKNTH